MAALLPKRRSVGPAANQLSEAGVRLVLLLGLLMLVTRDASASEPDVFEQVFGHSRTLEELPLEIPVIIDGRLQRSVPARVTSDLRTVRLKSDTLVELLEDTLRPDLRARIADDTPGDGYVPLAALEKAGLMAEFDGSELRVALTIPPQASRLRVIRLRGGEPPIFAATEVEPQAYSAFVNVRGSFDWVGSTSSPLKRGLQPVRFEFDGAANLRDWVLEGAATAEEDARYAWKRREVRLVREPA